MGFTRIHSRPEFPGYNGTMKNLLWVDLEMTGLDVEKEVVIEIAAIVTDLDFNERETYHAVVQQPQSYLDNMDDWNRAHHGASGLTALVPNGVAPSLVEDQLIALVERHFPAKNRGDFPVLAGNSIGQDRLFINRYFKRFASKLHYRMLDVTSWKILFKDKFNREHKKGDQHRALDDIRESIAELKYYLQFVKID